MSFITILLYLEDVITILTLCSTWDSLIPVQGKRGGFDDCLEIPLRKKTENAFLNSKMDFFRLNYKLLSEIHVQLHPWQFQLLAKSSKKSIYIDMIVESMTLSARHLENNLDKQKPKHCSILSWKMKILHPEILACRINGHPWEVF